MRPTIWIAFLLLALNAATAPNAEAANGGAAVAIGSTSIRAPFLTVPQPDSGALVVYIDAGQTPVGYYAQRVDRRGRPQWGAGVLVTSNTSVNGILPDGSGGALMVGTENRGATGLDVVVYRVDANGALPYGPTGLVVCNALREQNYPKLEPGPAGSYYVVWEDDRANLAGMADVYAQRLSLAGTPQWSTNGIAVNAVAYRTSLSGHFATASDFGGGIIVAWSASSNGQAPRAQRLNSGGAFQWTVNGVVAGDPAKYFGENAPDGAGGLWTTTTTWDGTYSRSFINHVLPTGAAGLPAAGIEVVTVYQNAVTVDLIRNASGGCFIYDYQWTSYNGNRSIHRQEVNASGTLLRGPSGEYFGGASDAPTFFDGGTAVIMASVQSDGAGHMFPLVERLAFDGTPTFGFGGHRVGREWPVSQTGYASVALASTGVIMATWADGRYATPSTGPVLQVFGQAFTSAGVDLWDDAEIPVLETVSDSPGDQGGRVRVTWKGGVADHPAARALVGFRIWRALPGSLAKTAELDAARAASREPEGAPFRIGDRLYRYEASSYWELAGEQPAATLGNYARTVTTQQDSIAGFPANELFMVEAYDDSSHHWFSGTLSGHSVDNLAPAPIPSAAGYYADGEVTLYWGGVADADLCCYEVFRGATPGFTPGPSNHIASTGAVTHVDDYGAPAYYRIAARDIHGNLGVSALIVPSGAPTASVGPPVAWALHSRWNAASRAVELALDVADADEGRLELFDVAGRRLWSESYRADAAQSMTVRATPEGGIRPGVVYARAVSTSGRVLVAKAVVLR